MNFYFKINVDSLPLVGSRGGLATSMKKAVVHFTVGAAFIITRFFFVHLVQVVSRKWGHSV
ncbi:hypothetical protein [Paenibacillus sp. N3.4]|uniref:hypothetical protein n=1 Tax=Paenibacillus sp. N3.4 TaxID=2603222 RepID=UPI00164EF6BB|nr:hypothetical protein [Paenibacillus sp. N3.4]